MRANLLSPSKNSNIIRGVKFTDHSTGSCFKRCPELFGRKRVVRNGLKKANLAYIGRGRYKGEILEGGRKYAFILWIDSHDIATVVTMWRVDELAPD